VAVLLLACMSKQTIHLHAACPSTACALMVLCVAAKDVPVAAAPEHNAWVVSAGNTLARRVFSSAMQSSDESCPVLKFDRPTDWRSA